MQTSNFSYKGAGRVVISRGIPRYIDPGYTVYKKLAPGYWFKQNPWATDYKAYRERFFTEILASLNAEQVYNELHAKTKGIEPILLCYEDIINKNQWCHRRMVAEWFENELGVFVPEYMPSHQKQQASLF